MTQHRFIVPEEAAGLRLDQCLSRCIEHLSRQQARVALDLGAVFVDRKRVKVASRRVSAGQRIEVNLGGAFDRARKAIGRAARLEDEAALPPFEVLFEDAHLVLVNKPAGLLSAPTPESDRNNLQSLLSRRSEPAEPVYVVHRLDLQASGVMVYAKTRRANRELCDAFRRHALTREYDVFAAGHSPSEFTTRHPLHGRPAITHFTRVVQHERFCHLTARLETGRTHQIRLHLLQEGLPVLADPTYGSREEWHPPRLALHAARLEIRHPDSGALLSYGADLPCDLSDWYQQHQHQGASASGACLLPTDDQGPDHSTSR